MAKMKQLVDAEKPPKIISVGDVVSRNLHSHSIHPQVSIIDNKSLRDQTMPEMAQVEKTVRVANPQGTITAEAEAAVKAAMDAGHVHIVVDGEEDLLTLVAVRHAPLGAFVVYGQPHVGVVVVKVDARKKAEFEALLKAMDSREKLNRKKTV